MLRESEEEIGPTQFRLLLHSVPQLGEKALARLLRLNAQQRLTPKTVLALSAAEWKTQYDLHPAAAEALEVQRAQLLAQSREMARTVSAHNVTLLSLENAVYPARLDRYDDAPPPLLYALGRTSLLDWSYGPESFTFTLAVSNGADAAALPRLDSIAAELVRAGGIPVTGHDRAPYKRLALAAQRQNRPVIYVFDRGLREALGPEFDRPPFAAARIRDAAFDTGRDLALSSFRLDDHSLGANNRRRDRIVFALSDLIIALDVRAEGGMFDECLRAFRQNRPVFTDLNGRDGCVRLQEAGCPVLPDKRNPAVLLAPRQEARA